jgi:hypothetical protein
MEEWWERHCECAHLALGVRYFGVSLCFMGLGGSLAVGEIEGEMVRQ